MNPNSKTWIVKFPDQSVKGPFDFDEMISAIDQGRIELDSLVADFPKENWRPLAQVDAFSEHLYRITSQSSNSTSTSPHENVGVETIFMPVPEEAVKKQNAARQEKLYLDSPRDVVQARGNIGAVKSPVSEDDIIQLQLQQPPEDDGGPLKTALIVSLVGLIVGLIYLAFDTDSASSLQTGEKVHLIGPRQQRKASNTKQIQDSFRMALSYVEADTFESYLRAQDILASLVESLPNNLNLRGMLCVVYYKIWPFSYQDSQDQKVLGQMAQTTRSMNYLDPNGVICESVRLITQNKYKEARSLIDNALNGREAFSLMGALHFFKGYILEGEKNYVDAYSYYESARGLWPNWAHIVMSMARVKQKMNEPIPASQYLRTVLQRYPKHKEALVSLGLIEYRNFRQSNNALAYLSTGMKVKDRIPKTLEAEAYVALAEISLEKTNRAKAREYAQKAYELDPRSQHIQQLQLRLGGKMSNQDSGAMGDALLIGDQYMRQGDCLTAQSEFKAVFEANPKLAMAALKAAKCLWQLNQSFEAIEWLKKAIKSDKKFIAAYVLQADYLAQRFDFVGAMQTLLEAKKIAPKNHEVFKGFALLEYRKGNLRSAIEFGKRSSLIYDGDVETYVILSNASATYSANMVPANKAEIQKKDELKNDAIRFASHAVEIDSTNVEAQITYARRISEQSGVDSGISYLRDLANRFSFSHEYKIAVADLLQSEERFSQAIEYYQQVVELDQRNKKAFLGLGQCYKAMGQPDKALKAYLNAAIIDPSEGDALFEAGKLYFETNRFDEAIDNFNRVVRVNPNYPRVNYYLGKTFYSKGNLDQAIAHAKREKKLNPNLADSYILMAEIFTLKKQYGGCASEYATAIKLRPQGAEIYVKSAQCYRAAGSLDIAEDMLALAATKESGYADIYREQGLIFETKGDGTAAAQAFNKYLGLSPNAADRAEIEAKLLQLPR